jgi:hypothetical protein
MYFLFLPRSSATCESQLCCPCVSRVSARISNPTRSDIREIPAGTCYTTSSRHPRSVKSPAFGCPVCLLSESFPGSWRLSRAFLSTAAAGCLGNDTLCALNLNAIQIFCPFNCCSHSQILCFDSPLTRFARLTATQSLLHSSSQVSHVLD